MARKIVRLANGLELCSDTLDLGHESDSRHRVVEIVKNLYVKHCPACLRYRTNRCPNGTC